MNEEERVGYIEYTQSEIVSLVKSGALLGCIFENKKAKIDIVHGHPYIIFKSNLNIFALTANLLKILRVKRFNTESDLISWLYNKHQDIDKLVKPKCKNNKTPYSVMTLVDCQKKYFVCRTQEGYHMAFDYSGFSYKVVEGETITLFDRIYLESDVEKALTTIQEI